MTGRVKCPACGGLGDADTSTLVARACMSCGGLGHVSEADARVIADRLAKAREESAQLYTVSTATKAHAHRADSRIALCGFYSSAPTKLAGRVVASRFDPGSPIACATCARRATQP